MKVLLLCCNSLALPCGLDLSPSPAPRHRHHLPRSQYPVACHRQQGSTHRKNPDTGEIKTWKLLSICTRCRSHPCRRLDSYEGAEQPSSCTYSHFSPFIGRHNQCVFLLRGPRVGQSLTARCAIKGGRPPQRPAPLPYPLSNSLAIEDNCEPSATIAIRTRAMLAALRLSLAKLSFPRRHNWAVRCQGSPADLGPARGITARLFLDPPALRSHFRYPSYRPTIGCKNLVSRPSECDPIRLRTISREFRQRDKP